MNDISLHNNFTVTLTDENNVTREATAYNVVTTYGINSILDGHAFPSYIALGNGEGTPSVSDKSLFAWLSNYAVTKSASYDAATMTCTYTFVTTLDEDTLADTDITEIGIGTNGALYTHAMFTDALGQPITIHKGPKERMTITAIAYISFSSQCTDSNIAAIAFERMLANVATGSGNIALGTIAQYCYTQKTKNDLIIPVPYNILNQKNGSYSNGKVSFKGSLSSNTGSGVINAYFVGMLEPRHKDSYASSLTNTLNRGIIPIDAIGFEEGDSPMQLLGTGDDITSTFKIPKKIANIDKLKLYKNNVEVPSSDYTVNCTGHSEYDSNYHLVYNADNSNKRIIVAPLRLRDSSRSGEPAYVPERDMVYYEVSIGDDGNVTDITANVVSSGNDYFKGTTPSSGNLNTACILPNPPYFLYKPSLEYGTVYHVDDDLNKTVMCTNCAYYVIDKDDINTIITPEAKYTIDPETKKVTRKSGTFYYFPDAYKPHNLYKYNKEKVLQWAKYVSNTEVLLNTFDANTGTLTSTTHVFSDNIFYTTGTKYGSAVLLDLDNRVLVTACSTGSSSTNSSHIYVHFLAEDNSTIESTVSLTGNWQTYTLLKRAKNKYYGQMGSSSNGHYYEITVDYEAKTATIQNFPHAGSYLRDVNKVFTTFIEDNWYYMNTYVTSTIRVPTDYEIIFNTPPSNTDEIKYTYGIDTIQKDADWQLETSYSYGYNNV